MRTIITGQEEYLMERAAFEEAASSLASNIIIHRDTVDHDLLDRDDSVHIFFGFKEIPKLPFIENVIFVLDSKSAFVTKDGERSFHFPALKSYKNNNEVVAWIINEGKRFNIDLSNVASALFVNSGIRLRKLNSEIRKISELIKPGTTASISDIKDLISLSAELTPSGIVDAINDGNTAIALRIYEKLNANEDETGWIQAFLLNHVLQISKIRIFQSNGIDEQTISSKLAVHPYVLKSQIMPVVPRYTKESLRDGLENLIKIGHHHRTGQPGTEYLLQSEIIRLSEGVKNVSKRSIV